MSHTRKLHGSVYDEVVFDKLRTLFNIASISQEQYSQLMDAISCQVITGRCTDDQLAAIDATKHPKGVFLQPISFSTSQQKHTCVYYK